LVSAENRSALRSDTGCVCTRGFVYGIVCESICTQARSDAGSARRGACGCLSL